MIAFRLPDFVRKYDYQYQSLDEIPESVLKEIQDKASGLNYENPLASVVVIAYNEEKNLLRTVASLVNQKITLPYEVIVVNNNSTDRTGELIEKTGVKGVFKKEQGPGHARQGGLEVARGKYHICADADMIYPPTHVETMVKKLNRPNTSVIYGTYSFIPEKGKSRFNYAFYEIFRDFAVRLRSFKRPELAVGGACMAFYTEEGKSVGWRTDIWRGEDGSMLRSLLKFGKARFSQSSRIRGWSSPRTLLSDGSYANMIWIRIRREFRRLHEYFYRKKGAYADGSRNQI